MATLHTEKQTEAIKRHTLSFAKQRNYCLAARKIGAAYAATLYKCGITAATSIEWGVKRANQINKQHEINGA